MSSVIFSGSNVKTLKRDILFSEAGTDYAGILCRSTYDPTVAATAGNPGTILIDVVTGQHYKKLDSGTTTNWAVVLATSPTLAVDSFSGDGSTTGFTLSVDPGSENNTQVYISGVYQSKATYSVSGTTLTFSVAPPTGTSNIEVLLNTAVSIGTPSNSTVSRAKLTSDALNTRVLVSSAITTFDVANYDTFLVSGSSRSIVMPDSSDYLGKVITIIHNGTSLTQKYSMGTTAGESFAGKGNDQFVLCTRMEKIQVVATGSAWIQLMHETTALGVTSWTPVLSAGFGTPTQVWGEWEREGRYMIGRGFFVAGTVTATVPTVELPAGAVFPTSGNVKSTTPGQQAQLGTFFWNNSTTLTTIPGAMGPGVMTNLDASTDKVLFSFATDKDGTATNTFFAQEGTSTNTSTSESVTFEFRVPISDWEP